MTPAETWTDIAGPHVRPRQADGRLIYAVGDVHGCYDELRRLLGDVAADIAVRAAGRTPVLVFCGDYVDRGPASAEVIEAVAWLKRSGDVEVRALMGNHEDGLLGFLADPVRWSGWLDQGGEATLASYGVAPVAADAAEEELEVARDALDAAIPPEHRDFLDGLELWANYGDVLFVHAGLRAGVALAEQTRRDLLWIRRGFLDHEQDAARLIVHGHSWADAWPQVAAGRLGIDTGAYETGVLTAIRIDAGRVAYARTAPAPARKAA